MSRLGVVVIGRNEGEGLRRCLASLEGGAVPIVYVDSGSSDGSAGLARGSYTAVVELEASVPFTAARARNAGVERLLAAHREIDFVQFVDGDCELVRGWLERAAHELGANPRLAIVCGRRRERFPGRSIYNRLCDIEWDTPVGEVKACGGDAMVRVQGFREVGGFDPRLIAGEEPEICVRLRRRGWKIVRLDAEMTLHDAAMTRFVQWWRRALRSGYAFAEGAAMHGRSSERHRVHETRSVWFWGFVLPLAIVGLLGPTRGLSLTLAGAYPALAWRISRRCRRRGMARGDAWLYSLFCVMGKFPQCIGQARFLVLRILGRRGGLIEHRDRTGVAGELP